MTKQPESRRAKHVREHLLRDLIDPKKAALYLNAARRSTGGCPLRPGTSPMARNARRTRPGVVVDNREDVGDPQVGSRGHGQRPSGARTGRRHPAVEERENPRGPNRELADTKQAQADRKSTRLNSSHLG